MNQKPKFWQNNKPNLEFYDSIDKTIYKYVSLDTATKIIESNSLLYASPNSFNDPFEMSMNFLDVNLSSEDVDTIINDWNVNEFERTNMREYYQRNPHILSKIFFEILEEGKNEIGVTCFSKSYMKTLMWSHYANKHAGLCLGFNFEDNDNDDFVQAEIKYVTKVKTLHYIKETRQSTYDWVFSKSHVWAYEEEVRRFIMRSKVILNSTKKNYLKFITELD